MLREIFFDQNNTFQWVSIAAITSVCAFISTAISIYLTQRQGNRNRKSTTLVHLRIDDLKEIRAEAISAISMVRGYIKKEQNQQQNTEIIIPTDPISIKLDTHLTMVQSKLYRESPQSRDISMAISMIQLRILKPFEKKELVHVQLQLQKAIDVYSKAEYNDIENYL